MDDAAAADGDYDDTLSLSPWPYRMDSIGSLLRGWIDAYKIKVVLVYILSLLK